MPNPRYLLALLLRPLRDNVVRWAAILGELPSGLHDHLIRQVQC